MKFAVCLRYSTTSEILIIEGETAENFRCSVGSFYLIAFHLHCLAHYSATTIYRSYRLQNKPENEGLLQTVSRQEKYLDGKEMATSLFFCLSQLWFYHCDWQQSLMCMIVTHGCRKHHRSEKMPISVRLHHKL